MPGRIALRRILLTACLAACGESGGPLANESDALLLRSAGGAVIERGAGLLTFDAVVPFSCAGEDVRSIVYMPYEYQKVLLPTGEYVYHDRLITELVTGSLIGQSSGTVWTRTENRAVTQDHSTGGGSYHYSFTGTFISETGPTIEVHELFMVMRNANGELTVDRKELRCRVK